MLKSRLVSKKSSCKKKPKLEKERFEQTPRTSKKRPPKSEKNEFLLDFKDFAKGIRAKLNELESESDILAYNGQDFSQKWKIPNSTSPLQLLHSALLQQIMKSLVFLMNLLLLQTATDGKSMAFSWLKTFGQTPGKEIE